MRILNVILSIIGTLSIGYLFYKVGLIGFVMFTLGMIVMTIILLHPRVYPIISTIYSMTKANNMLKELIDNEEN